jgi:hypothetical protein
VKYLFVVLIPIVLLLGCEKETITPEPEINTWQYLCSFPTQYHITSFAGDSDDCCWICGFKDLDIILSTYQAFVGRFNGVNWQFFNYPSGSKNWCTCIGRTPFSNEIWLGLIDEDNPAVSGIYKYNANIPNFPFQQVVTNIRPVKLVFLDANTGISITENTSMQSSKMWIYNGVNWTEHPFAFDVNYMDSNVYFISMFKNPDLVVYVSSYDLEQVFRICNDVITSSGYIEHPGDIYMLDDDNGFRLMGLDGSLIYRKNGDDWYSDDNFHGAACALDGIGSEVWIFGGNNSKPKIWRWENEQYYEESVDDIIEIVSADLQILKDLNPVQGFIFEHTTIYDAKILSRHGDD